MTESQPNDAFGWTQEDWGRALRCLPLANVADHFFTTRAPLGPSSGGHREGWMQVASTMRIDLASLVRLRQVHSARVVTVRRRPSPGDGRPQADGMATTEAEIALAVQVADCVPLLLADTRTGAIAAAHAGWRGTAAGVAGAAVTALSELGSDPGDIVAAVGPSIGPCCYEVGPEVLKIFSQSGHHAATLDRWFVRWGASLRLDLWQANRDQLETRGLLAQNIHVAGLCTASHPDLFYSHRAEGAGTGRMAAVIKRR